MRYTVTHRPEADDELTKIWLAASDRDAVTQAADFVDRVLERDPYSVGESREGRSRILFAPPLVVFYEVDDEALEVTVTANRPSRP